MRPNPKNLSKETLDQMTSLHNERISKARESFILTKNQNPTFNQLIDHIQTRHDMMPAFIRGLWNIATNEWVVIISDVAFLHNMLCDCLEKSVKDFEVERSESYMCESVNPLWCIKFSIDEELDFSIESEYYHTPDICELSKTGISALKYKIGDRVMPELKRILSEPFPYHETPRLLTSIPAENIDMITLTNDLKERYKSGEYIPRFGDLFFEEAVDEMRGKEPLESHRDFMKWLDSQEDDNIKNDEPEVVKIVESEPEPKPEQIPYTVCEPGESYGI